MNVNKKRAQQKKRQQQRSAAIVVGAILIIILSVVTAQHHTSADKKTGSAKSTSQNNTTTQSKQTTNNSKSTSTDASKPQSDADRQAANSTSAPAATAGPAAPNTVLAAPSGNFVSTHRSSMQNTINSVCTTTPGASCALVFTNGATTRELSTQPTDVHGSAHWAWQAANIGLSPGNWTVTARATLGDQVKDTADPEPLVITN